MRQIYFEECVEFFCDFKSVRGQSGVLLKVLAPLQAARTAHPLHLSTALVFSRRYSILPAHITQAATIIYAIMSCMGI